MHKSPIFSKLPALGVHLFTSTGILAGFMAILSIQEEDWRAAAAWCFLCQFIDGVDGTLARYFKVEDVLPQMDGKTIDQVIDFATYAIIPALFFYHADLVEPGFRLPCVFAMLLSAAMYYGKKGMVSEGMHFIGFPVLWNVVVFYLFFVFNFSPHINAAVIMLFAVLHFIPVAYPYPTRALEFRHLTLLVSFATLAAAGLAVWDFPERNPLFSGVLIGALFYYAFILLKINREKSAPSLLEAETPLSS